MTKRHWAAGLPPLEPQALYPLPMIDGYVSPESRRRFRHQTGVELKTMPIGPRRVVRGQDAIEYLAAFSQLRQGGATR